MGSPDRQRTLGWMQGKWNGWQEAEAWLRSKSGDFYTRGQDALAEHCRTLAEAARKNVAEAEASYRNEDARDLKATKKDSHDAT